MENKNVGYMLLGISLILIMIIILFNATLKSIIDGTCPVHPDQTQCPAYTTLARETYLSFAIVGILVIVSLFLIFSKPHEKIIIKKIKEKIHQKEFDLSQFRPEEKQVFKIIQENKAVFQSDLIDKTGFGKAKITRILDRLEGNNLIERKRRGMTNIVVLKEN